MSAGRGAASSTAWWHRLRGAGPVLAAAVIGFGVGAYFALSGDDARAQGPLRATVAAERLVVFKSPTCLCCGEWVEHARELGFTVDVRDLPDVAPTKRQLGVPLEATSCHTTTAGGYVFEGHIPADLIAQVLETRPAIAGLAVPGMPQSAPGMYAGGPREPYEVLQFRRNGEMTLYAQR
jgi:hypothetical protein